MHSSVSGSQPPALSRQYKSKLSTTLDLPPTVKPIDGVDAGMSCPLSVQSLIVSLQGNEAVQQTPGTITAAVKCAA